MTSSGGAPFSFNFSKSNTQSPTLFASLAKSSKPSTPLTPADVKLVQTIDSTPLPPKLGSNDSHLFPNPFTAGGGNGNLATDPVVTTIPAPVVNNTPKVPRVRVKFDSGEDTRVNGTATGGYEEGLANPKMSQASRRMLDLVNGLHSTGVQVDIDLPQIAVIGNQSAGKSSLIESISGIMLPRATGTCTRCPTECRLSRSDTPWTCVVSLRITTDSKGQPLGQPQNETFGSPIYDKSEVEDRIRRAQLAILNPHKLATSFLRNEDSDPDVPNLGDVDVFPNEPATLTFSMNCVSLSISGPDVADLSFVDLPGLIASVGQGGKSGDIKLIEGLVTSYIKKSNCIILLTVACETDFENQGAHQIAKIYDPEGTRTIGVLTKPDRIPTGEESSWLSFLRNEKEPLKHNWFCVKQPSSNDLKQQLTWEQARRKEDEFFASTAPWNELEGMYARHLRTGNLVERLSNVLSELVAKRLPEIQDEIENMINKTQKQIELLPKPPPKNALNEVAKLIKDFDSSLRMHIEGVPDKEGIIQQNRAPYGRFRSVIRRTAPEFRPFKLPTGAGAKNKTLADPEFLTHEEEGVPGEGSQGLAETPENRLIPVDEVYQRMEESRARELPGYFPFVVQRKYIDEALVKWHRPAAKLCDEVFAILMGHVKELVQEHFGSFGQGALERRVRSIMHEHLSQCLSEAKKRVEWLMKIQREPFTLNNHYYADYKDKFLTYYRRVRKDSESYDMNLGAERKVFGLSAQPTPSGTKELAAEALSALAKIGYPGLKAEDLAKLLGQDKMEPALEIMATVRAYFQVAYKRFIDSVPMAIDYELVRGSDQDVFQLLWSELGLDSPDARMRCDEYAQEAAQTANKREEYNNKLERLTEAVRRLAQY